MFQHRLVGHQGFHMNLGIPFDDNEVPLVPPYFGKYDYQNCHYYHDDHRDHDKDEDDDGQHRTAMEDAT